MYADARLKILSGRAHPALAESICQQIGVPLGAISVSQFADGETRVVIQENVRGCDVFIIQPTLRPNESLMELLLICDALRRASARRITAVMPYYGYARQDRKLQGREPITAKLVANLLTTAGADRVLTIDLHAGQIQGFFDIPVDHLTGIRLVAEQVRSKGLTDIVVVSPDAGEGGIPRARGLAESLHAPLAVVDKRRPQANQAEVMNVIGPVQGRVAILVDDIIDTAGTIVKGAAALVALGAREVYAAGVHALLSPPAVTRLKEAPITELMVTDTLPLPEDARRDLGSKLRVISVAPLLGDAIIRIHEDRSISELFR
ncbi:MAG TPA: ribose-phosphate pyrophosphokinase [Bacillota bacterium]|nr:ribose-phosphate pyrophosphokinase [Bacillota bacterium]